MAAFRWGEMPGSGNATAIPASLEKLYFASGKTDENFVLNYANAATPAVVFTPQGTLYKQDIKLSWQFADYCVVTVPYGPNPRFAGNWRFRFTTSGGTVHITSSRSTVSRWGVGGIGDAPNMKQTIGVNGDDVDGCDIVVPALKITISFQHPQGAITLPRVKQLARNTGYVNNDEFLTFAAGEALFLGASGQQGTDCEASVDYEFAMAENADGAKALTIGDIANVVKEGHDYAWIRYVDGVDAGRPIKKAKHVYVERVYERTAFVDLFGFGA